jgi:hypothetical protein
MLSQELVVMVVNHLAVDVRGEPYEALGFDYAAHNRWVADGFCPVVSQTRAYCGKRPGHSGLHGSPRQEPDGDVTWTEWDR